MHEICKKNMQEICRNMHEICRNMQVYAGQLLPVSAAEICKNMQIICICKNMQNMQSRFAYAKYAKICTPHFADVFLTTTFRGFGPLHSSFSKAATFPEIHQNNS